MKLRSTFAIAAITLFTAFPSAHAYECMQADQASNFDCREIDGSSLDVSYCLKPELMDIRAVSKPDDIWVTKTPIKLDFPEIDQSYAPGTCALKHPYVGWLLAIAHAPSGASYDYDMTLTRGSQMETSQLSVAKEGTSNDIWLTGVKKSAPNVHYFVFLRDKPRGADPLAKYLMVEGLDYNDGNCSANAPKLNKTVLSGQCPAFPLANPPKRAKGGLTETEVGGGGEHR